MNKTAFLSLLMSSICSIATAQSDSSQTTAEVEEVVVTATRSERAADQIAIPVMVITQQQIAAMGALRLTEVLAQQTGLFISDDHGQGIQLQGLDPDYTLILLDGEPMVGRTAGTFALSRVAVGNIKRIEIIKGASSSLYGSEALAGVINIITDNPKRLQFNASARYGANNIRDFGANFSLRKRKMGVQVFANHYGNGGYDFSPDTYGKTVAPYYNVTLQNKWTFDLSPKTQWTLTGRYFEEWQRDNFELVGSSASWNVDGRGTVRDWNAASAVKHEFNQNFKLTGRFYTTQYHTAADYRYQIDNSLYDSSYFTQRFTRPELMAEWRPHRQHSLTLGVGNTWESVSATRYNDIKHFNNFYTYAQHEWAFAKKWQTIAGFRFDAHSVYHAQLSPKLAIRYDHSTRWTWQASAGVGFKAPDFRQLYLNFSNASEGYSVFGSYEAANELAKLQQQGQIDAILVTNLAAHSLKAERSLSLNAGGTFRPHKNWKTTFNIFRNDVYNLIETYAIARKMNGRYVYSYRNLNQVFTEGIEIESHYTWRNYFTFSLGYQYLIARDKAIIEDIKAGTVYRRNPQTLASELVTMQHYGGLFNRSAHTANFKINYDNTNTGWAASLRVIYRGRYGLYDTNGNLILDDASEYVKGYTLLHLTASKTFKQTWRVQAGCDNVLGYRNTAQIPTIAGRLWWVSVAYFFNKQHS